MGGFVAIYNFLGFRLTADPFGLPHTLVSLVFLAYLAGTWASARAGAEAGRFGRRTVLIGSIATMIAGTALTLSTNFVAILAGLLIATAGFFGAHAIASGWVGLRLRHRQDPGVLAVQPVLLRRVQRDRLGGRAGVRCRGLDRGGRNRHRAGPAGGCAGPAGTSTTRPAASCLTRWPIVTVMDFSMSAKAADYHKRLTDFMVENVFPAEAAYHAYREDKGPKDHTVPPVVEELKAKAKAAGLWNLFLPSESGLTNLDYAPLAELTGWSMEIAPEVFNCAAPDTGNMETLHLFADRGAAQAVAGTAAGR